jgi:ketosteroid isomerase-like protein
MTDSSSPAKTLVTNFWAAFSSSDFENALALLAADATWWVSGSTDISGTYTKSEFAELVGGIAEQTESGIQVTPSRLLEEGGYVAMEATSHGLLKNGKVYNNYYHFLHEVRGGRITTVREYMDTEHVTAIFGEAGA